MATHTNMATHQNTEAASPLVLITDPRSKLAFHHIYEEHEVTTDPDGTKMVRNTREEMSYDP